MGLWSTSLKLQASNLHFFKYSIVPIEKMVNFGSYKKLLIFVNDTKYKAIELYSV